MEFVNTIIIIIIIMSKTSLKRDLGIKEPCI
jgi:hypothetical protein